MSQLMNVLISLTHPLALAYSVHCIVGTHLGCDLLDFPLFVTVVAPAYWGVNLRYSIVSVWFFSHVVPWYQ